MFLDDQQTRFIVKRQRLLNAWRYTGPLMAAVVFALVVYIYIQSPMLINPFEVASRLESGDIERTTLETMALLLPIVFIMTCALLAAIVVLMYTSISIEKRYQRIVQRFLD